MVYIGECHARGSSAMYFPKERVVFGADVMQVKRLPLGAVPSVNVCLDALRTIERLDFDIAATGHAMSGTKADAILLREYYEELSAGVAAGVAAGKSFKEIQQSLTFDKFKAWERYDTQPRIHIAEVYATLRGTK